jgi:hypothetical protein
MCAPVHATSLLVCSGSDGVVVSADSRGHSLKGEVEDYDKLQLVGERVVVAEAGLLLIRDSRAVRFDVHAWVAEATRKLGRRPGADQVASQLVKAAARLRALADHPSVVRAQRPQIILLVASFDRAPRLRRVVVDLKPFAVSDETLDQPMVEVGMGAGHLDDGGPLLTLAKRRRPDLAEPADLAARADWCGWLLTVEAELNPLVAPPIRQALLGSAGAATRRIFPPGPASSPAPSRR